MNRLQHELNRLFVPHTLARDDQDSTNPTLRLVDANGHVRAMVMAVSQRAGWAAVATLWQGVQDDLDLPAPAIAVSGVDGYQVWFSLQEPVPLLQARAFSEWLRLRYLGHVAPRHVRFEPEVNPALPQAAQATLTVPAIQPETGHWSAFVAPGLASMFADEPWLELAPNPDAQANLLSAYKSITPKAFALACARLKPNDDTTVLGMATTIAPSAGLSPSAQSQCETPSPPKAFLLAVMNDTTADLSLRIDAAKALLPYFERMP